MKGVKMKITIIHGQSHEGSTCHIARMLAENLNGETVEFFLPRDFHSFCTGCTACFAKSETLCPHCDELRPITEAMDAADVIILASPVYVFHTTGSMKAFLDHYGYRWMVHRPEEKMFRKQAVCISTAAGAGMGRTNKDMADSAFFWGIPKIYKYGFAVMETSWNRVSAKKKAAIEKRLSVLAAKIQRKTDIKAPIRTRAFFHLMRLLMKRGWNEADRAYWNFKGWTADKRPWK